VPLRPFQPQPHNDTALRSLIYNSINSIQSVSLQSPERTSISSWIDSESLLDQDESLMSQDLTLALPRGYALTYDFFAEAERPKRSYALHPAINFASLWSKRHWLPLPQKNPKPETPPCRAVLENPSQRLGLPAGAEHPTRRRKK